MIKRLSFLTLLVLVTSVQIAQAETNAPGKNAVLILGAGGSYKSTIGNMLATDSAFPDGGPFRTCRDALAGCSTRDVNVHYSPNLHHYVIDTVNTGVKGSTEIIVEAVKGMQSKYDMKVSAVIIPVWGRFPFNVDIVLDRLGLNKVPVFLIDVEYNGGEHDVSDLINCAFNSYGWNVAGALHAKPCYEDGSYPGYCLQARESILTKLKSFLEAPLQSKSNVKQSAIDEL